MRLTPLETVILSSSFDDNETAVGAVMAVSDGRVETDRVQIRIMKMPAWFQNRLQARGIFIASTASWDMHLFLDHKGTWTDTQTLQQFNIWRKVA